MAALDVAETVRTAAQIDRILLASSESVERLCHRVFYPTIATRYLNWPTDQLGTSYRVYLDGTHELISLTTLSSNDETITSYFLEPQGSGPPYTRLELDLSDLDDGFGGDTHQRAITLTGVFGACADTELATTTAEILDSSETGVDVAGSVIGVGDTVKVDDEYMIVTGRSQLSTGATLNGAITASPGAVTLALSGTFSISPGEVLTVDAERMLVTDAYDSTVVVQRAWSGSALAAHADTTAVRAPRTLTVRRGCLGTTAATHSSGASVYRHTPPALVTQLTIAETLVALAREQSGYSRTVGADGADRAASGGDIKDLREQVYTAHGRKVRKGAI